MATFYGVGATKQLNQSIPALRAQGTDGGDIKVCLDTYTLTATKAQNDVIKMGRLPAGARVIDCVLAFSASLDASGGTLEVGWAANSVDAADDDGFMDALDVTTSGGGVFIMNDDKPQRPGIFKQFSPIGGDTQVQLKVSHSGGLDATTGTITCAVYYVID